MEAPSQRLVELLEVSGPRFYALLTRLTLRADVADDLLQELFLRLQSSSGFALADNPEAYAYRVAVRLAFDWRRQLVRRPQQTLHEELVDRQPRVDDLVADGEQYELLLAAMTQLSKTSQHILTMRFLEQHSYATIARQLERSPHQVRALCHKAIQRLRVLLSTSESPSADLQR